MGVLRNQWRLVDHAVGAVENRGVGRERGKWSKDDTLTFMRKTHGLSTEWIYHGPSVHNIHSLNVRRVLPRNPSVCKTKMPTKLHWG